MRTQYRFLTVFAFMAALCANAHADAGLTLKKLTWDPRQPDATPYQDVGLDLLMNQVIVQAWANARDPVTKKVVQKVSEPNRLKRGVTLYNVDLHLSGADPQVTVLPHGGANGGLRLFLPHSEMVFSATHPLTSRDTDPRFRVSFDLTIDVDFRLSGRVHPPIEVLGAKAQPAHANVQSVNATGAIALMVSEIESAITHDNALGDLITQGVENSKFDVTGMLTSQLRGAGRSLDIPAGHQFNGGRVDPGRIILAAWQAKVLPKVDIPLQVSWDGKWGRLLPNCEPVSLRISLPYAPPPFGEAKHIDSDNFPSATPASVQIGKDFACNQTIAATQGVTGTLAYKEMVIDVGHPRTPGTDLSARAVPVNWSNPLLAGDATRGKAQFRLDVREGMHDGSLQHDRAQEVLARKPGDPVERNIVINPADRVSATTNPADRVNATVNPAQRVNPGVTQAAKGSPASRINGVSRVADDLNPQPLPPGPPGPPDRSKAAAVRAATSTTISSSAPASSINAPASSLQER